MIIKGKLNFLFLQLSLLWNFSQGYLRPCTNTSLGAPNGTTVYAEIGKPVSVLFCVESETTIHHIIKIKEPQHRAMWSPVNNTKVGTEREGRVVTNITINNVQQQDLNVTFSVKVYTDLHANTGFTNDEWLRFTFILQKPGPDKIESFIILPRQSVIKGSIAKMICTAAKCSEPLTMKIVDDTGTVKKKVIQNESLIHEIGNVQCSDMGTYFCRVETESGTNLEEQLDLKITRCAPQICRGEHKTKTVHTVVGQSLNVSVCIVSYYMLSWQNPRTYRQVQVSLTPRTPSSLYYTVTITISNIQEQDRGNITIKLYNSYGRMDYTINLQVETTTSNTTISSLSPPSTAISPANAAGTSPSPLHNNCDLSSQESKNYIFIIVIVVLIVIVIALVTGVLVYRYRGSVKKDNSKDSHINLEDVISPRAHYEEIGKVDAVLLKGSSEQTKKAPSDAHGGEVQYEIAVTQASSVDTEHNYEELKDEPPVALQSYKVATVKPVTESPDNVEYENTLCII